MNNDLPDGSFFNSAIPVSRLRGDAKVKYYSSLENSFMEGVIHILESKEEISLEYDDGTERDFANVIIVGNNEKGKWRSISKKGDSGSILYDANNHPFGMIIGGCKNFTYALPLSILLETTNTKVFNQQELIV